MCQPSCQLVDAHKDCPAPGIVAQLRKVTVLLDDPHGLRFSGQLYQQVLGKTPHEPALASNVQIRPKD